MSMLKVRGSKPISAREKGVFRGDIQGLRAVAVLAVIADHLFHWPSGGFVGVDIFFVISGFLISGHLVREYSKTGGISFVGFYKRRVKRILPAAVLVTAVTLAASWALFNASRAQSVTWDAAWAMIFSANWHFAAAGTDYMQLDGPMSPLQHFWSLAVEEQFYFVWPILIVLTLGHFTKRRGWATARGLRVLGLVMAGVIACSFIYAMWETSSFPTWAYFSTASRTWELAFGALLALIAPLLARIPGWLRPVIGWAGIAGIVASLFTISPASSFPGPWAILPVISAGLVIASGVGGVSGLLAPLTNALMRYLGDISYSLYLWHFPIIIFVALFFRGEGPVQQGLTLVLTVLLAVLSYHVVETPIRKSGWLTATPEERARSRQQRGGIPLRAQYIGLSLLAAVTFATVAGAVVHSQPASSGSLAIPTSTKFPSQSAKAVTPADELAAEIATSASATAWPALVPSIDEAPKDRMNKWDECLTTSDANITDCRFGPVDAKKTAVVIGDSVALSWVPGLSSALASEGYAVQPLTMQQCPAADVVAAAKTADGKDSPGFDQTCAKHRDWALAKVAELHPDIVIMSNTITVLKSGASGESATGEWVAGLTSYQKRIAQTGATTVVIGLPPEGQSIAACATKISQPSDCMRTVEPYWTQMNAATQQAVAATSASGGKISYVNPRAWFCTADGKCPAFVGTTPVRVDTLHLTQTYSKKLAPILKEAILTTR